MLFSKTIEPRCAYCKRGKPMEQDTILCKKKGITQPDGACPAPDFSRLKDEDFTL